MDAFQIARSDNYNIVQQGSLLVKFSIDLVSVKKLKILN